ncbi:MAG: transcription antitermination factor NusB [Paludibacteraceae bacterium]|nr:transcription antitermination factor NusB [Paludibacteraceae bacterium]
MINRTLIRIKTVQIMYAFLNNSGKTLSSAEKDLLFSLEKTYELYNLLLLLSIDITEYAQKKIDLGRRKLRPTEEDLNPNVRFVDNLYIAQLKTNITLNAYVADKKISWSEDTDLVKKLYDSILESSVYQDYMATKESSYEADKQMWRKLYKKILLPDETLNDRLESLSIFWNDDIEIVVSFVEKTIKRFAAENGAYQEILPMYKEVDDKEFALKLIRNAVLEDKQFTQLIEEYTKNWEIDRIAFIDRVIMKVALAEITDFPSIPVNVSLNEYIEIAKVYSTDKSSVFVNGVLDTVVTSLRNSNKLLKVGFFSKDTK